MDKRKVIFGDYNTADEGWTLAAWSLSAPEQKTNYVEKTGGDGSWDLSTVMSDGVPRYRQRELSVTLECSEGDRDHREELISELVNLLDGYEWQVILPDHPDHYITGRLHVAVEYSDLAHACVIVTGTCDPWLESSQEKIYTLKAEETEHKVALVNGGRKVLVPEISVAEDSSVLLRFGASSISLTKGAYTWPALVLPKGAHELAYSGTGTVTVTYREAVLR